MDIPMELSKIVISDTTDQQIIVLKEVGGSRAFPIVIGINEAQAIDRRLKGIKTERPMTHDLVASIIEQLEGELEKIVITDLRNHIFYAHLIIRHRDGLLEVDSRPSDAIALGVASEVPIFVADHVLDEVT